MKLSIVILAAGQGERMKSKIPKVLHPLAGQPMVRYVVDMVFQLTSEKPVLVVGCGAEQIRQTLGDCVSYVEQEEQLGTGHALLQARPLLEGRSGAILVLYADMPLLSTRTLRGLVELHGKGKAPITMLTVCADDPMGFGRIIRDEAGHVVGIVEEAVATEEQRKIRELNCGTYCFDSRWLWPHLPRLPLSPKGEYYLTDLIAMAVEEGHTVEALQLDDPTEALGINNRLHLAQAEAIMRKRINERWMLEGVTMIDPSSTFIDAPVQIGQDTVIYPHTYLQGETKVGRDCRIGPNTIIRDSSISDGCVIQASVVEGAILEDDVDVGPFSHLRQGAHLARGVHVGNFGEVKNSYLGPGTKMGHFSYVGDATVGKNVNIGAGTITCNYDGVRKNPTVIEDGAFIGSDTMLVAPVKIGARAKIGAGAVVTHDIPPDSLAYGVPARVKGKVTGDKDGNG
ncbi:MAG: bifunctional UDP-N-acetylglucosamine diphosphorylase/glucosamine-1-phosphate N-acetyltransferase GlmU [Chloroflexota bacterium]|nr:bifunctional UDP-N-acetylglucosamine diphosphorylase/glucosamine-1-phosphate N-acetyltransferase GlmU [Chloroflexota bacterium]